MPEIDVTKRSSQSQPERVFDKLLEDLGTLRAAWPRSDMSDDQRMEIWKADVSDALKAMASGTALQGLMPFYIIVVENVSGFIDLYGGGKFPRDFPISPAELPAYLSSEMIVVALGAHISQGEREIAKTEGSNEWLPWKSAIGVFAIFVDGKPVICTSRRIFNREMPWNVAVRTPSDSPWPASIGDVAKMERLPA